MRLWSLYERPSSPRKRVKVVWSGV
jgi:hypothetical protein